MTKTKISFDLDLEKQRVNGSKYILYHEVRKK